MPYKLIDLWGIHMDKKFNELLKELYLLYGIDSNYLAEKMHLSIYTIRKLENKTSIKNISFNDKVKLYYVLKKLSEEESDKTFAVNFINLLTRNLIKEHDFNVPKSNYISIYNFGEYIIELKKIFKISDEEMCKLLGISTQNLLFLEKLKRVEAVPYVVKVKLLILTSSIIEGNYSLSSKYVARDLHELLKNDITLLSKENIDIGMLISVFRKSLNLTQENFGNILSIHRTVITKLEKRDKIEDLPIDYLFRFYFLADRIYLDKRTNANMKSYARKLREVSSLELNRRKNLKLNKGHHV